MGLLSTQTKKLGLLSGAAPLTTQEKEMASYFAPDAFKAPSFTMNSSTAPVSTAPDTVDFLRTTAQGIAREAGAVGQGLLHVATGGLAPATLNPDNKVAQAVYGTDKPISLQSVGEEYPFVKPGSKVAPFLALGGFLLNVPLEGASSVLKTFAKEAARMTTKEEIEALAKATFKHIDEVSAKDLGIRFASITDPKIIEKQLSMVQKEAFKLKDVGASPHAEEIANARIHLEIIQDALADHPGKGVGKHINNFNGEFKKGGDAAYQDAVGQAASEGGDLNKLQADREAYVALKEQEVEARKMLKDLTTKPAAEPIANSTRETTVPGAPGEIAVRPLERTPQVETNLSSEPVLANSNSVPALESVKHLPEDAARSFKQAVEIGAGTTKEPTLYRQMTKKMGTAYKDFFEYFADREIRVKDLMERKDVIINDASNRYQKATLYPGRVATKIEDAQVQMESIVNDLVDAAETTGKEVTDVRADVNEYLQAVHAPERNAVLGDGAAGMTNEEAQAVLKRIDESPEAAQIKKIATQARELNQKGLVLLRDAGVISDDLYKTLVERYKNHVPLNRLFEHTEDVGGTLSSAGFDVRSSGIKRAKGSEREVSDILSNIQHNYEQAVLRSEKNIVDQATLAFVRDNRESLKGLMEVRKPRAVGKTFDNKVMMERTTDPSYLQMFENGKPIWIKVTDPALAVALKGIGREKLPAMLNAVGAFTRFYSGLATRFNPEFALPNKLRDLQEALVYTAAQKDMGFKGAASIGAKNVLKIGMNDTKAIVDALRGVDSAGSRAYKEMKDLGGTTGGFGLSTRKDIELNLDEMIDSAKSRPKQTAQALVRYVDAWNTIFEDSTRLSVYKQALSQGLSKERAAFLAKEATINFNRMGRGGPIVNAIWMFSNASIQGSVKMVRALKNPKVLAAVTATVGASVAAVNEWNDQVDPQWRDKVTKWDRLNGLPVMLPNQRDNGTKYFVIPVSWGIKPIKVMADHAYDSASGQDTNMKDVVSDLFTSVADAYNPLGGTDAVSAFSPTILDTPIEIVRNQSWSGSKIRPDFDKNAPKDVQYFKALGETSTGRAFIEGTKKLQETTGIALSPADLKYGFDSYIGGAGKAISKTLNTAFGFATGKDIPADEYPFISRFYRTRTQEEVGQGGGGDTSTLKGVLENQSRDRFYETQAAEDKYTELKALSASEAAAKWNDINKDNPVMAAKIADIAKKEKKGLDYTERLITQLGVENGQRASYIVSKLDELKSDADKANMWKDYVTKGIITKQVADQITYLLKQQNEPKPKQSKAGPSASDVLGFLTGAKTAQAAEGPNQNFYIRDNTISASDLEEAKAILFGEVSNRSSDKQMLEAQTILNTAFNRMDEYRKRGIEKTLTEVLRMPNQYQAYGGKQYTKYKSGAIEKIDHQKIEAIDAMLAKVRDGTFQNNIGNYTFYSHKPDGRIIAVGKPLFKQ